MRIPWKRLFSLMIAAVLLGTAVPGIAADGETLHVVILATSDMHGNIWGYSYEDDAETTNNGMARLYSYIRQAREENPIVFLVDAGDDLQGTILTDTVAVREPEKEHPVIAAMNAMGYDAMTVGNHEFNWGIPVMKRNLSQADFPVLGANILDSEGGYVTGKGWTIVERGGVRLAVIGVCTPEIPRWDGGKEGIAETTFEAASTAVKKAMEEIGDQADILLVSAHMGRFPQYDEEGGSDSAAKIVEDNPGIDILQVAHMHITENGKIGDVPFVGVRNRGREIARIDVTLDRNRQITDIQTKIIDMAGYEPSPEIREIPVVKAMHEETIRLATGTSGGGGEKGTPLGTTTARFQPENEIRDLPEGRLRDTAVMDLILKIQLLRSGADVTSVPLFNDDGDLPEGEIYYKDIFNIYKHDNTLYTMDVTGAELKKYMEWSAEYFNTWKPGDINISFDPDVPGYNYDMFAGVDYEINLSRPKGQRIENVTFKGEPLRDDQVLKLAVNNYRYSSCIKTEGIAEGNRDWESSGSIRDMIVEYFAENSPVAPETDNNWRITGVDLSTEDPRRAEIIGYINAGFLQCPYDRSYNLGDYDAQAAEAEANRKEGKTFGAREDYH